MAPQEDPDAHGFENGQDKATRLKCYAGECANEACSHPLKFYAKEIAKLTG